MQLSIILPCFNEGHRLPTSIHLIHCALRKLHLKTEIIVVDDGSTDDTSHIAHTLNLIVLSYPINRGKGYAINQAMQIAKGELCLFMDADLATDLSAMEHFINEMTDTPVDILIGNRTHINQHKTQPFLRRLLSKGFIHLTQSLFQFPYVDINCGFKMFNRRACGIIFKRQLIHRWSFDAELLYIARKHDLRIKEMPVLWHHQPQSKVRLGRDIYSSLFSLISIRLNDWKGLYT